MSEKRKTSLEYFHVAPDNLNCAQAVLKSFQKEFHISEEEINLFRAWGGGRAENGVCGALFAAKRMVNEEDKNILESEFKEQLGSLYCKELKKTGKACEDCVDFADQLLEKIIKR